MNKLPHNTCDTHVHIFDPQHYKYASNRAYTPAQANLKALRKQHDNWGVHRTVLVQPSIYGTDNRCLLAALDELGTSARAVAVINPTATSDSQLAELFDRGARGIRVNFAADPSNPNLSKNKTIAEIAERLKGSSMFMQVYCSAEDLLSSRGIIENTGIPIVLDHFAGITDSTSEKSLHNLRSLILNSNCWLKISADYRMSESVEIRPALINFIQSLLVDKPLSVIWGSDWPHTGGGTSRKNRSVNDVEPFRKIDISSSVQRLMSWCESDQQRNNLLVHNSARLFGF